jgi:hypothetical protein
MGEQMQLINYRAQFLTIGKSMGPDVSPPEDEIEGQILTGLRGRLRKQAEALSAQPDEKGLPNAVPDSDGTRRLGDAENVVPVFDERGGKWAGDESAGEYQYYQPVYWKTSCDVCHLALQPGAHLRRRLKLKVGPSMRINCFGSSR